MDVVKLRRLAFRSVLNYGKYYDLTVRQIMDLDRALGITYLAWCYFNCSKISFLDEVLDELRITEDMRFDKPGKEPYKMYWWKDTKLTDLDRLASWSKANKRKRLKSERSFINDRKHFSSAALKNRNQGHK